MVLELNIKSQNVYFKHNHNSYEVLLLKGNKSMENDLLSLHGVKRTNELYYFAIETIYNRNNLDVPHTVRLVLK